MEPRPRFLHRTRAFHDELTTHLPFPDADAAYAMMADARRGLDAAGAAALDARVALILANHIGDLEVLAEAIALAKRAATKPD